MHAHARIGRNATAGTKERAHDHAPRKAPTPSGRQQPRLARERPQLQKLTSSLPAWLCPGQAEHRQCSWAHSTHLARSQHHFPDLMMSFDLIQLTDHRPRRQPCAGLWVHRIPGSSGAPGQRPRRWGGAEPVTFCALLSQTTMAPVSLWSPQSGLEAGMT